MKGEGINDLKKYLSNSMQKFYDKINSTFKLVQQNKVKIYNKPFYDEEYHV